MKIELDEDTKRCTASVERRIRRAFSLFADGMYFSTDLNCSVWEFAVTIKELRDAGLSDNDIRWLIRKCFVEHAVEVTQAGDDARSFRPSSGCILSDRACFVWTETARALAFADRDATIGRSNAQNGHSEVTNGHYAPIVAVPIKANLVTVPTWDYDRQELRWGEYVVKQFKVPSPNQETILAAFEEEHWPPRIDDPLSPRLNQEPKRRLHDTITTLNRNQKHPLIRFLGDGSGEGVRWEPVGSLLIRNGKQSQRITANSTFGDPTDA
jgi:hypothetical protein